MPIGMLAKVQNRAKKVNANLQKRQPMIMMARMIMRRRRRRRRRTIWVAATSFFSTPRMR
jgi:hypothetical protein